ncbi:snare-complex protein syntaxin-18 N-terminus-domain-containing protein [Scheffersomyces coipomensis]|uniref:snare-complex protein syntaxin-18 N-terminus-domain-containing protein n=1 Tax=Scheffersomyces coipomensis TaxID=1788519 RepID=UPI00315CDA55
MTDLTPLFDQCVQIVQSELSIPSSSRNSIQESKPLNYIVKDTFIKESIQFYDLLTKLNQFTIEVKSQYLAIHDEVRNANNPQGLTNADKDAIDEQFNAEIRQLFQKLSVLETYESQRQSKVSSSDSSKGWFDNVFGDSEPSDKEVYLSTISQHRNHILKFLMISLSETNKNFESIQKKRQIRNKQLDSLNFQNLEEDELRDFDLNDTVVPLDSIMSKNQENEFVLQEEESQQSSQPSQLSTAQIQELELESKEFLKMKTNQLKQVQKVQQSIIDIINIQNDLSFKLQSQEEQINTLLDNTSQMHIDVKMGNQQLTKATSRNKKGANMLVTLCFVLGFLIIFVDYISF